MMITTLLCALTLSADFTTPNGKINRDLHSSGFGPQICSCPREYIDNLKSFGMKASRTHDWALINPNERVCDNHMVFPLDHLDPKDPKSYYFKASDFLLKRTIEECGHDVFYRLGTSIEHAYYGGRFNCNIPKDFNLVAENFAATVRHYNRGWADGFKWNIKYWELWNEPDGLANMWWLSDDDPRFDNKPANVKDSKALNKAREVKSQALFVEFFVTCLKRLKSEFGDSIKVGGPAMCSFSDGYFRAILKGCKEAGVAPDFISWHHYIENSDDAVNAIRRARKLCDEMGFPKCELIINEWHYFSYSDYNWEILRSPKPEAIRKCWTGPRSHNGIDSSAFFVSTVSRFHDTPLAQSYYYGCNNIGSWGYMDSLKRKYKIFYALQLMGKFMKNYTDRFAAKGVDPNGAPIATILAAKSKDGRKSALLIGDYRVRTDEITVDVKGIPSTAKVSVTVLDNTRDNAAADFTFENGKLTLKKPDQESAVYLVEFDTTPMFVEAESVWPKGLETEMNTLVAFRAPFELKAGEKATLKLVAWYSYRVTLNGKFVAFGPARGPKGYFRADELDLAPYARVGKNELMIEVAGYNVPNFYLMEQPPFLKAEVVVDGTVRAATKTSASAFAATLQPRVKKVPRYSYQRTFAEVYRLPDASASAPLALAAAPEPTLIPRRAPYPKYEFNPKMKLVSFAKVREDPNRKLHNNRSLMLPGTTPQFKGYKLDELEVNSNYLAQRLVSSGRRAATADEMAQAEFAFKAGESAVFDNGLCDTGFPGLRVTVREPGRLALQFDEVLFADGGSRGILRYRDCCNVIVWDFTQPGVYEVDSFEPYVMRYAEVDVLSGAMTISAPRFRSYKNPTAAAAEFRASDPDLVKIFDAAKETFRQNAVDVFMDCPSRERAGWNCDAYFTAPVSTLLTGNGDLEKVFEENMALPKFDDIPDGMIPMCYPSDNRTGGYIPNWAMWFVLETEEYLRRTGDREMIARLRPRFEKLIDFFWRYRNSDGLLEKLDSWVFVEWSRCNRLVQDVNYPSNMTWADVLDAMNRLYGRADLAAEAKRVRAEILRQSWTGKWFCDNAVRQKDGKLKLSGECTETCQYYAFFHRIATPESHPELWKTMLNDFGPQRYDPSDRKKLLKYPEIWPSNAFIGNYLRLKLLERHGLGAQILRETKGYFKYMADRTGTLWENDTTCASCNHGFASYAAVLLVRSVLGLDVDMANKTVTVLKTDANLDFCGVTLPTKDGNIVFDRVKKNGAYSDSHTLPAGWRMLSPR